MRSFNNILCLSLYFPETFWIQKALVDGCVNTAGCNRRGDVRALEQLR